MAAGTGIKAGRRAGTMGELNPLRAVTGRGRPLPWRARCRLRLEAWAARLHRRPVNPEHQLGRLGEELAYWFLRREGYTIVARNYRLPRQAGELDLIGREGETLAFVEVKSRERRGEHSALGAVDGDKRRQLQRLARAYRRRIGHDGPIRFDVVAVYDARGPRPEIELHRDAFAAS